MLDVQQPELGTVILRFSGELGSDDSARARRALVSIGATSRVHLDLDEVQFVDSAGLGVLVSTIRKALVEGTDVSATCTRPTLRRLLHTTGFDRVVRLDPPDDPGVAGARVPV